MAQNSILLSEAREVIASAERKAAEIGVPVNIAVLDGGAHLTAFCRMDGAVLGSIEVAIGKARTAVLFAVRSEAVWEYCKPGAPAPGLENTNGGLVPFAGGIPLLDSEGRLMGAVGVSGGAVPQDLAIAEAGAASLGA